MSQDWLRATDEETNAARGSSKRLELQVASFRTPRDLKSLPARFGVRFLPSGLTHHSTGAQRERSRSATSPNEQTA
jgi:hypothetical protein